MKPEEIHVGETYVNRGAGKTRRYVIAIGYEYQPDVWLSSSTPPDEPGVFYLDSRGRQDTLYLSSFARWAGGIADEPIYL